MSSEEIRQKHPEEYAGRELEGKYWYRLPGGENYPDVESRVHDFLDKLVRDETGKNVLIVTHHVPYVLFRALFDHMGEEVLDLGNVPNCGVQIYEADANNRGRLKRIEYNAVAYDSSRFSG
jgi:broad specificity phosphatase PhoE